MKNLTMDIEAVKNLAEVNYVKQKTRMRERYKLAKLLGLSPTIARRAQSWSERRIVNFAAEVKREVIENED